MKIKLIKYFVLLALMFPALTRAQTSKGFICNPGDPKTGGDTLATCVPKIFNTVLSVSGLLALAILIYAGYTYMTAGGNGQKIGEAKEMVTAVFSGIALLALAYILLRFLDPSFVQLTDPF